MVCLLLRRIQSSMDYATRQHTTQQIYPPHTYHPYHILLRWTSRNELLHHANTPFLKHTRGLLAKHVHSMLDQKNILPSNRHIFSLPLETLLTKPARIIQLFVAQNKPIVKQSIRLQRNLT